MNTYRTEIETYEMLNGLAEPGGAVVFGGSADREIPVSELRASFGLNFALYNRSLSGLTLETAVEAYDAAVAPLAPERVLLHVGDADRARFADDPAAFDRDYRALIAHIRGQNHRCDIAVISLRNPGNLPEIDALNRYLQNLAASERCEFCDISTRRVWNPAAMKETVAFMYQGGFVRPLRVKMPAYDLVRILYGYDSAREEAAEKAAKARRIDRPARLPKPSFV